MQLRIAVCDDEKIMCDDLSLKIIKINPDDRVDTYDGGCAILKDPFRYDLLFMDIDMPDINGMDISRQLREKGYKGLIVFLTSHTEFMKDAFKVKAFRFLTKPVDVDELEETLRDARRELSNEKVMLMDNGAETIIDLSEIYYIKSNRNKTFVRLSDNVLEVNKTLGQWLDELDTTQFCQVHKSYIVSLAHIEKIDMDTVVLSDINEEIPLSRRSAHKVKEALCSYVEKNARWM